MKSSSTLKIPKINKPLKLKSSRFMIALNATERLYYQDSIRRIVKQSQIRENKLFEEKEMVNGMKPEITQKSRKIIEGKREGLETAGPIY